MFTEQIFYIFICVCGFLACIKLCCNLNYTKPSDKIIRRTVIGQAPPPYDDNISLPRYEDPLREVPLREEDNLPLLPPYKIDL